MNIIEITVGAGTSFPHPHEGKTKFSPSVTIRATLGPDEDGAAATRRLQKYAHAILIEEQERILALLGHERELIFARHQVKTLGDNIQYWKGEVGRLSAFSDLPGYSDQPSKDKANIAKAEQIIADLEKQRLAAVDRLAELSRKDPAEASA